ncbi:MAG: Fe(2+)-trafficking protein, partial [Phycisphaeraceae bacterium]|nr:Fe(2+)-trafficking protein [Phycisphaeraceae bacterium]
MDIAQRIAQFENMVQADPTNDMAHYSLGNAYSQAGRHRDAAESYVRCYRINKDMSKAYQLAGAEFIACNDKPLATEVLKEGYTVASQRGDFMPKKAIADLLKQLGEPIPEVAGAKVEVAMPEGTFMCKRTGRPGTKLARPPFKGPIGNWIFENISAETWKEWIGQGTKVINELRLDLSRDDHAETYDQHMREYLGIDENLMRELSAKA